MLPFLRCHRTVVIKRVVAETVSLTALMAEGRTNGAIASTLVISEQAV